MKNWLLFLGVMLFGMIGLGDNQSEAAGPVSWSQKLRCETSCSRFTVLRNWDNAAVLDKETGLVWEQSPDSAPTYTWAEAQDHCNNLQVSNRMGWRLPTLQELTSLIDTSQADPSLPSAHPFSNVANTFYWTATTYGPNTSFAWVLDLSDHSAFDGSKVSVLRAWCVRGGSGIDTQ